MFNIGIFIYDGAEILDFCGPFEVFNGAKYFAKEIEDISVFTVGETLDLVNAQGLSIKPQYDFANCPKLDIFLVPGREWIKTD
jgi:putative intracellular protease/amidase